jgi:hypothetical protein
LSVGRTKLNLDRLKEGEKSSSNEPVLAMRALDEDDPFGVSLLAKLVCRSMATRRVFYRLWNGLGSGSRF